MANEHRAPSHDLSWLERLARDPSAFDFYVALRRFDAINGSSPRIGTAERPGEEPVHLGQRPSMGFESRFLTAYDPASDSRPARLTVGFLGLWGPSGPMPTHLTEYARERMRNFGDATLVRFADIFHHRMLALFYRAWAKTQPTVEMDRPSTDAFARFVGALCGLRLEATHGRPTRPESVILHYAARSAAGSRSPEGLRDILADHFGLPVTIEEFVGEWIPMPTDSTWRLRMSPETGRLGATTVLGRRVWSRAHKFRVVVGPLGGFEIDQMLPGSTGMAELVTIVRHFTNDEWEWDVALRLTAASLPRTRLGLGARLGWSTRLGGAAQGDLRLIVDPERKQTRRARDISGTITS
jgi:type VI secretion system protein ImpH